MYEDWSNFICVICTVQVYQSSWRCCEIFNCERDRLVDPECPDWKQRKEKKAA